MIYLCFQLIAKAGVVQLDEPEEQSPFLDDGVVLGNLLLHVFFQKRHITEETACEGAEELEEQFYVSVIPSENRKYKAVKPLQQKDVQ